MKKKCIVFGCGNSALKYVDQIENDYDICAISDSKTLEEWHGYRYVEPSIIKDLDVDYIVVPSSIYYQEIFSKLVALGVAPQKIKKGWYKEISELDYWKSVKNSEGEFANNHYRLLMLGLAEKQDDEFWRGKIVADFGCGPRGSLAWTNTPTLKIGIDILIPEYMKIRDLSRDDVVYVTASEKQIPIPDDYVDYLLATEVLDRVQDIRSTIREITRIIKPGGVFMGCFPLHESENEDDGQTHSFDESAVDLLDDYELISKRIARRTPPDGSKIGEYSDMLAGKFAHKLGENEKGFLWFRARKK